MPRNPGTGIYTKPYPDVISDTTIESTVHNGEIADIETDLNTPRPIVAGGTGANNVTQARVNLGAEASKQQVTNFDTYPFQNGSWYSDAGATSAPDSSSAYTGIYIEHNNPNYADIYAENILSNPRVRWHRAKHAGVWQAWEYMGEASLAALDGRYVNVTGDAMIGPLSFAMATGVTLDNYYTQNAVPRWLMRMDGATAGLILYRFSSAGELIDSPAQVNWTDGRISVLYPYLDAHIASKNYVDTTTVSITGDTMNGNLNFAAGTGVYWNTSSGANRFFLGDDGASSDTLRLFTPFAGNVWITDVNGSTVYWKDTAYHATTNFVGPVWTNSSANINGSTGGMATSSPGHKLQINSADINSAATIAFNHSGSFATTIGLDVDNPFKIGGWSMGNIAYRFVHEGLGGTVALPSANFQAGGTIDAGQCFVGRAGGGGATSNRFSIYWTTSTARLYIDTSDCGQISLVSDYRIKKDVIDLPGMWDTVKGIRPIKYTNKNFTPPDEIKARAKAAQEAKDARAKGKEPILEPILEPLFTESNVEQWGFVAHELQQTLTPSAATGTKDMSNGVQSLNIAPVVAALTKALQEAMARIEALEAAQAPT